MKPNDAFILYRKGVSYYLNKKFKKALKNLEKALMVGPFSSYEADIYYHVGISHSYLEAFGMSIEPFTRAIELCRFEAVYYHERAKSFLLVDEFERAIEDFTIVIQIQPNNAHAYFGRGFAHKNIRNYSESSEDFERAKDLDPRNPQLVVNYKKLYNVKFMKLCNPGEEQRGGTGNLIDGER